MYIHCSAGIMADLFNHLSDKINEFEFVCTEVYRHWPAAISPPRAAIAGRHVVACESHCKLTSPTPSLICQKLLYWRKMASTRDLKTAAAASIDGYSQELREMSDEIWRNPELAYVRVSYVNISYD